MSFLDVPLGLGFVVCVDSVGRDSVGTEVRTRLVKVRRLVLTVSVAILSFSAGVTCDFGRFDAEEAVFLAVLVLVASGRDVDLETALF